jgi:hypothetical protein
MRSSHAVGRVRRPTRAPQGASEGAAGARARVCASPRAGGLRVSERPSECAGAYQSSCFHARLSGAPPCAWRLRSRLACSAVADGSPPTPAPRQGPFAARASPVLMRRQGRAASATAGSASTQVGRSVTCRPCPGGDRAQPSRWSQQRRRRPRLGASRRIHSADPRTRALRQSRGGEPLLHSAGTRVFRGR